MYALDAQLTEKKYTLSDRDVFYNRVRETEEIIFQSARDIHTLSVVLFYMYFTLALRVFHAGFY